VIALPSPVDNDGRSSGVLFLGHYQYGDLFFYHVAHLRAISPGKMTMNFMYTYTKTIEDADTHKPGIAVCATSGKKCSKLQNWSQEEIR